MQLKPRISRMSTDYQSDTIQEELTWQVDGFKSEFLPEFFCIRVDL